MTIFHEVTGNVRTLAGVPTSKRARVMVISSVPKPGIIVDTDGDHLLVGDMEVQVDAATGDFTIPGLIDYNDVDTQPFHVKYMVFISYPVVSVQGTTTTAVWDSGWLMITEDADLADPSLLPGQYSPPEWQSGFMAQANALLSSKVAEAEAIRQYVNDVSNIALPDSVITAIDSNPASAFRQQQDARLSTSFGEQLEEPGTPARVVADALFARTGQAISRPNRDIRTTLAGRLLVGANGVPTPAQVAAGATAWALLVRGIIDNTGNSRQWVSAQHSAFAGEYCDGNAVRWIGAAGYIGDMFTLEEYLFAMGFIVDDATSKGLMVYPCLFGDWRDFGSGGSPVYPDADQRANLLAVAKFLDGYGSVIGLDLCNEYRGHPPAGQDGYDNLFEIVDLMDNLIRPAGVSLPLSASVPVFDAANLAGSAYEEADWFDIADRHPYFESGVPLASQIAALSTLLRTRSHTDTPIIFGEANLGATPFPTSSNNDRAAYIDAMAALSAHPRVAGFFTWAIADQGTTSELKYGLFSGTPGGALTPRAPQCAAIKRAARRHQGMSITKWLNAPLEADENTFTDIVLNGVTEDVGGFNRGGGLAFVTIPETRVYQVTLTVNFSSLDATAGFDCWAYIPDPDTGDRDARIVSIRADGGVKGGYSASTTLRLAADTQIAATIYYANVDGGGPAVFMEGATRTCLSIAAVA